MLSYITINIDPVLVHIGPLTVRWYGLMYAIGLGVALWVTRPIAERRGVPREAIYTVFWTVTVAGLLGGRLYYIVQNGPTSYMAHPSHIFALWEGGMAFYGTIFLGVPTLYLVTRRLHISFLPLLDVCAIFAPLAQAIGRVGNVINGDIVGYPSTLPWATAYAHPGSFARPLCAAPYAHCVAFQPAAVYELLCSACIFLVLWRTRDRRWPRGIPFVVYLALYSLGQLILFAWRNNVLVLGPFKQAQVTAIVVLIILVPITILLYQRHEVADQGEGQLNGYALAPSE